MDDTWIFSLDSNSWSQVELTHEDFKPIARSGHSTVVYGNKMYIFGGILELTKELNDLVVFDFNSNKFSSNDVTAGEEFGGQNNSGSNENDKDNSPKPSKGGSPMKRRNPNNTGMSPSRFPTKKRTMHSSPSRSTKEDTKTTEKAHDGL